MKTAGINLKEFDGIEFNIARGNARLPSDWEIHIQFRFEEKPTVRLLRALHYTTKTTLTGDGLHQRKTVDKFTFAHIRWSSQSQRRVVTKLRYVRRREGSLRILSSAQSARLVLLPPLLLLMTRRLVVSEATKKRPTVQADHDISNA